MNFGDYEENAMKFAGAHVFGNPYYSGAAMAEEVGEYLGQIKHETYHGWLPDRKAKIKELGDILWYLVASCRIQGTSLEEVAQENLTKLSGRYKSGIFTKEESINRKG